jgi:hypothetical protein
MDSGEGGKRKAKKRKKKKKERRPIKQTTNKNRTCSSAARRAHELEKAVSGCQVASLSSGAGGFPCRGLNRAAQRSASWILVRANLRRQEQ